MISDFIECSDLEMSEAASLLRDLPNKSIRDCDEFNDRINLYQTKLSVFYAVSLMLSHHQRKYHGVMSSEKLQKWILDSDKLGSGLLMSGIPLRIFMRIADCARLHTDWNFESILDLPKEDAGYAHDFIHPRFIAVMLQLGDALDMDNGRFHLFTKEFVGSLPNRSEHHFEKHQSIRQLEITESIIEIRADCPSQEALRLVRQECNNLKSILEKSSYYWADIVPRNLNGCLPTLKLEKLLLNGYEILPELVSAKFQITQKKAFGLLEGANIYENKFVFLRELLQNSIDASKFKYWNDCMSSFIFKRKQLEDKDFLLTPSKIFEIAPVYNYTIEIELSVKMQASDKNIVDINYNNIDSQSNYGVLVKVIDYGIGIGKKDILDISNVGSSYERQRKDIEKMPEWLRPTGEFGIGLQSVFLVANSFKAKTKTKMNECYELLFTSSTKDTGYINVTPLNTEESEKIQYGTVFEVFVPYTKKLLHSEVLPAWAGDDPFSNNFDKERPIRHSVELMFQMALYLDKQLGQENLFPILLKIEKSNLDIINSAIEKYNLSKHINNLIYSGPDKSVNKLEEVLNKNLTWIYKNEKTPEDFLEIEKDLYAFIDTEKTKLYIWDQKINVCIRIGGNRLLSKYDKSYKDKTKSLIDKKNLNIYYKGIFLKTEENTEFDNSLIEYIDIKNCLRREYLNLNRNGLTKMGEDYLHNNIYSNILVSINKTFRYLSSEKNSSKLNKLKENLISKYKNYKNINQKINKVDNKEEVNKIEDKEEIFNQFLEVYVSIAVIEFLQLNNSIDLKGSFEEPIVSTEDNKFLYNYEIFPSYEDSTNFSNKNIFFYNYIFFEEFIIADFAHILNEFMRSKLYAIFSKRNNKNDKWEHYIIDISKIKVPKEPLSKEYIETIIPSLSEIKKSLSNVDILEHLYSLIDDLLELGNKNSVVSIDKEAYIQKIIDGLLEIKNLFSNTDMEKLLQNVINSVSKNKNSASDIDNEEYVEKLINDLLKDKNPSSNVNRQEYIPQIIDSLLKIKNLFSNADTEIKECIPKISNDLSENKNSSLNVDVEMEEYIQKVRNKLLKIKNSFSNRDIQKDIQDIIDNLLKIKNSSLNIDKLSFEIIKKSYDLIKNTNNRGKKSNELCKWILKNIPTVIMFSSFDGNSRINILGKKNNNCILLDKNSKYLIIDKLLEKYKEFKISRFYTIAWLEFNYISVNTIRSSISYIKRGLIAETNMKKMIFPITGEEIGEFVTKIANLDIIKLCDEISPLTDIRCNLINLISYYLDSENLKLEENVKSMLYDIIEMTYKSGLGNVTNLNVNINDIKSIKENVLEDFVACKDKKNINENNVYYLLIKNICDNLKIRESLDEYNKDNSPGKVFIFIRNKEENCKNYIDNALLKNIFLIYSYLSNQVFKDFDNDAKRIIDNIYEEIVKSENFTNIVNYILDINKGDKDKVKDYNTKLVKKVLKILVEKERNKLKDTIGLS